MQEMWGRPLLLILRVKKDSLKLSSCLWLTQELILTPPTKDRVTPFFKACQGGHKEVVLLLLADTRIDVNIEDVDGVTPFFRKVTREWYRCS